jgi:insertion element IS1 protein InsB
MTGATVVALTARGIIAIASGSWVLTVWASAHESQMYRAPGNFTNSKRAVEVDEMWSFVGAKATERWLWHAIDHHTGRVLAFVVGPRKDAVFLNLKALLAPLGITHYDTDKAGVSQRHLPPEQHTVGKLTMQKIERKHLTLRTRLKRLVRTTLRFSRSYLMHDLLIGLYMNRVESTLEVIH